MAEHADEQETFDWVAEAETHLLHAALRLAERRLWGEGLFQAAAREAGLNAPQAELVAPLGARDLTALLFERHDRAALKALAAVDSGALKIRERIFVGVSARVEAAMADAPAVRRAALYLALPANAPLGARLAWGSSDLIWRWAGDTATDENHYSKRAILSGVLLSTLAVRVARGPAAAEAALRRNIEGVMRFEKMKARLPDAGGALAAAAARLGRLRYRGEAPREPPVG